MVEISIDNASAVFEVKGVHQLLAFKRQIKVPVWHIRRMHAEPNTSMGWWGAGLKLVGTDIPNRVKAGIFYEKGGLVFWDVSNPDKTLVVELRNEKFKKLVVEVASPTLAIQLINKAIEHRKSFNAA